jgi:hypothetical protein
MALPQKELTVRVEKIKLCPVNRREERIRREEEEEYGTHLASVHLDESSMVSNDKLVGEFRPNDF